MDVTNARRRDEGFTLLEVMIVVLILGILVAVAVATYRVAIERSQLVTCQSSQRVLGTAVIAYCQEHGGDLPPDLAALRPYVTGRTAWDTCPSDPAVHYVYEPTNGRVTCPLHAPQ